MINGCYPKGGGLLRVIGTASATCRKGETPIHWNVQGPTGPSGSGGVGAGYADFHTGPGGSGAISLPESGTAVNVITLDVPAGWASSGNDQWRAGQIGLVVTASVMLNNQSPVMGHPGCTVLSDTGGYGDGHAYVSGLDASGTSPTMVTLTFQTSSHGLPPPSQITLDCALSSDHPPLPPGTSMKVSVLNATLSVIPQSF